MAQITLDKLAHSYMLNPQSEADFALKEIDHVWEDGGAYALLGPSGCGKTTLLNILAGFLAPTEGQIVLNGHTVTGPDPERGMVFQKGALFEWMDVRSNVDFGPRMKGMPKKQRDEITDHLLEVVGLQDFKEKAVYELSGGMQQRVALARCLANETKNVGCSDPTTPADTRCHQLLE